MKRVPAKFILPLILFVLLGSMLTGYFLFNSITPSYYILVDSPANIHEGAPVLFEKYAAGIVRQNIAGTDGGLSIIRFSLSRDYSIPKNSIIQVNEPQNGTEGFIEIRVMASKDYYQPGDTIIAKRVQKGEKEERDFQENALVYKVQILASEQRFPLDSQKFMGIQEIEEDIADGLFKYYTGNLKTLAEAKKLRDFIADKGIADAFIVPFLNGQRISIQQARKYEK